MIALRSAALVRLHAPCLSSGRKDMHFLPTHDSLQAMHCSLWHELCKFACSMTGKGGMQLQHRPDLPVSQATSLSA